MVETMKHPLFYLVLAGFLMGSTMGCGCLRSILTCDQAPCVQGPNCESCGDPVIVDDCDSCQMETCRPGFLGCFPILGFLFRCNGCAGDVYWSEWFSDPPASRDPCDCCGHWNGPLNGGCDSCDVDSGIMAPETESIPLIPTLEPTPVSARRKQANRFH